MIIAIIGDPQTGEIKMNMEGILPPQARLVLEKMIEQIDLQFNNGQPPPRPSGLIIPAQPLPPPPPPPAAPPLTFP